MKKIIDWINRHFVHNRDMERDFGVRAIIHIPIGIVMGLLDWNNGLTRLFEFYERNEDRHSGDQAWKDVFGAMIGWVIGRLALVALVVWAVIVLVK